MSGTLPVVAPPVITAATFRAIYPAFFDMTVYPPEAVDFWLADATQRLNPLIWANLLNEGIYLFVAHRLQLARMAFLNPNGGFGLVSSKSIGGVSIAYNTTLHMIPNAGAYGLTIYGTEFLQLARLVGMGCVQL